MPKVVLDASALLAFVNGEPGAEKVASVLGDAMISAVNFAEAVTKLALRSTSLRRTLAELTDAELEVVNFDRMLAEAAGVLAVFTHTHGLSLGDRACLALARREEAIALTADHAWSRVDLGIDIQFIR
jgi:PIN domain nuclease of toxin-antitoxin system